MSSSNPPSSPVWSLPDAQRTWRQLVLEMGQEPHMDTLNVFVAAARAEAAGSEVRFVISATGRVDEHWLLVLTTALRSVGMRDDELAAGVRQERAERGTCVLSVWTLPKADPWQARRSAQAEQWRAGRAARRAAARTPTAGTGTANLVGRSAGRVVVNVQNALDSQPVVYIALPDQRVTLTLDVAGALQFRPESDQVVMRFRPGALSAGTTVALTDTPGWTLADSTRADGVRELTLAPTSATPVQAGPITWSLTGLTPSQHLGGHAMRIEVQWSGTRAGVPTRGVRSVHLAVMPTSNTQIAAQLAALATVGDTINGHQRAHDALSSQVKGLGSSLTTHETKLSTLTGGAGTLGTSLTAHETKLSTLTGGAGTLGTSLTTHETKLSTLTGSVSTLGSSLTTHETKLSTLTGSVSTLGSSLTTHETKLSTLTGATSALGNAVDAHAGRIGGLSDRHDALADHLVRLMGPAGDDRFDFWVDGAPTVAPSLTTKTLLRNELRLRVRNRSGETLTGLTFALDLGTQPGTGLPGAGFTATWTQNPDTSGKYVLQGTLPEERTVPTFAPGDSLEIKLSDFTLPSGTALGRRTVALRYYSAPSEERVYMLCERLPAGAEIEWASPLVPTGKPWTVEFRVRLARLDQHGDGWCSLVSGLDREQGVRFVQSGSLVSTGVGVQRAQIGLSLHTGAYRHALCTYDGTALRWFDNGVHNGVPGATADATAGVDTSLSRVGGPTNRRWDAPRFTPGPTVKVRDIRIWNRVLTDAEIKASAAGHRPSPIAPGLLVDMPLDDLDNTPRNHARFGRGPQPLPLTRPPPLPAAFATAPAPITGTLETTIEVSNLRQSKAGEVKLNGSLWLDRADGTYVGALVADGGVTAESAAFTGALTAGSAQTGALTVTGDATVAKLEATTEVLAPRLVGSATPAATNFSRDQVGGGRWLTSNQALPKEGWVLEARFMWPLPENPSTFNTLFRGASRAHYALVQTTGTGAARTRMLGAYSEGFWSIDFDMCCLKAGAHRIEVTFASDSDELIYRVDDRVVGTLDTSKRVVDTLAHIGDFNGEQSFGPIWDIKMFSGSPRTLTFHIAEGSPLPTGFARAGADLTTTRPDNGRLVPVGTILMWSGALDTIPVGWHLCDGRTLREQGNPTATRSVPDLRDRMIRGAPSGASTGTGGSDTVTLTTNELPSHDHPYKDIYYSESGGTVVVKGKVGSNSTDHDNQGYEMDRKTDPTGSGAAFSIVPSYHALAFIIFLPNHVL